MTERLDTMTTKIEIPPEKRFWKFVAPMTDDRGCWEWAGALVNGYGSFDHKKAHRVSWEMHFGPIPKSTGAHGTCVLHRCDNPSCVNPRHLFLGSNRDNAIDRERKGRGAKTIFAAINARLAKTARACPRGHAVDEINTGRRVNGTRYCRVCQRDASRAKRSQKCS
jgi:hypothetical protein